MKRNRILGLAVILVLAAAAITWAGVRSQAWLGVYTQEVDRDMSEAFALDVDHGAIVNEIVADSPAAEAGLEEDDIIISVDGEPVRDDDDLIDIVRDHDPNDQVKLTVIRDGKETELEVTLGRRPRSRSWTDRLDLFRTPRAPRAPKAPRAPHTYSYTYHDDDFDFDDGDFFVGGERPYIGVTLVNVSRRTARALGAKRDGVLIDDVEGGSPAADAGLQPGDLIVAINGERVSESGDIQDIIHDLDEGDVARIELVRRNESKTVDVTVELDEDGAYFGGSHILRLPDLPDIDLDIPRTKGLYRGHSYDHDLFDAEELREAMEEYEEQMSELKKELKELRKSLE